MMQTLNHDGWNAGGHHEGRQREKSRRVSTSLHPPAALASRLEEAVKGGDAGVMQALAVAHGLAVDIHGGLRGQQKVKHVHARGNSG